jgi:hypothetical protein
LPLGIIIPNRGHFFKHLQAPAIFVTSASLDSNQGICSFFGDGIASLGTFFFLWAVLTMAMGENQE